MFHIKIIFCVKKMKDKKNVKPKREKQAFIESLSLYEKAFFHLLLQTKEGKKTSFLS